MDQVVIDHCSEVNIEMALEAGASAGISVQPWRNMTPDLAADLVVKHGSNRIMINSDCGSGPSDPVAVSKTAVALTKKGASDQVIEAVCWSNSRKFYGIKD